MNIDAQTIIEGNKLIAEFMGCKYGNNSIIVISTGELWLPYHGIVGIHNLKYHKSWDWLIPVICQCVNKIGIRTIDECTDYEWNLFTTICDMKMTTPIKFAFENVITFIKWYNNNNCNK